MLRVDDTAFKEARRASNDSANCQGHAKSQMTQSCSAKEHGVSTGQNQSRSLMATPRVSTAVTKHPKVSKAAPAQSRVSMAVPKTPEGFHAQSSSSINITPVHSFKVHPTTDFEALMMEMGEVEHGPSKQDMADFKALTDYFMGFWKAPHAAAALTHLEKLEIKRTVRALQKRHGFWYPPPEVVEALKKPPPETVTNLPDTKDARNLKFVLKILGCSLQENKPYNQFLKAKSLQQKRNWLYKYQGSKYPPSPTYMEPVCPTRLKRLHQFFPDRFTDEDGFMYFNNKIVSYDETKNVFYIGRELEDD